MAAYKFLMVMIAGKACALADRSARFNRHQPCAGLFLDGGDPPRQPSGLVLPLAHDECSPSP